MHQVRMVNMQTRECGINEKLVEKKGYLGLKGCKAFPVNKKPSVRQPGKRYVQAAADKKRNEAKTEEKDMKTKTDKDMDLTDFKGSLQALREVKVLLQKFPTLLEVA
ncbi:hypothetical protein AVEN_157039-1 [Araneus ventricosus]|uniref:Uncharacterized protein n=1 Tax=Araneus ventricosus TaxID=182803 RepID=A0A4Y2P946_ARAVE|nr:hypothetical protein AVEN_157039-1 [Araneus ventricosus]